MSITDYVIDILLILVIFCAVRPHPLTPRAELLPLALLAIAGIIYLRPVTLHGNDLALIGNPGRRRRRPRHAQRPGRRPARDWTSRRRGGRCGKGAGASRAGRTGMRAQAAWPDREVRHEPACCGRCGAGLADRPVTGRTKAPAPQGAQAPVQYGPRIAAIVVYLYTGQFLSKERTAQALAELSGIPLSSGTVAGITARAAGRPGGFLEGMRDTIAAAEVAGSDETRFRVDGRLHWVHSAQTGNYTLLMVHPSAP
jgi:transposase